jgi:hypothetical protein
MHNAGMFHLAAQNGRQSYQLKNLFQLLQVKLLMAFQ